MKKIDARQVALHVLNEVYQKGAYANIALVRELGRHSLSDQERRFATELVYGSIKAGETLDWIIGHYVSRPLTKMAPVIRNILRLGMYQLFFLTKIPASAACNEAVETAKRYGHAGTVKFVNAVLRSAVREPEKIVYPDVAKQPATALALRYCHPEWIVKRWIKRLGVEATEELCRKNNETPLLSFRTNTLKLDRAAAVARLTAEGAVVETSAWTPEGIVCHAHPALSTLATLQEGLVQVQDESSMLVAHVLKPQPGEFIIDACSAPGGKATHIAALMNNTGRVLANDMYEHKLALIEDNASRLGLTNLETLLSDATTLGERYAEAADRVLVDAPCSGLGVLRRKPDARWRKEPVMLRDLPILQKAILHSAAACVKPGGVLVYSTCTTEPEENQKVVDAFLAEHPDFTIETTGEWLPVPRKEAYVQLWPHIDGVDGFFIARMVRNRG